MRIATWNLNNRVGKRRFRPEAARAAMALNADILVFTEFFPQENESSFRRTLENGGWAWQLISVEPTEVANRVLMASRLPLRSLKIELPAFDQQFAANLLAASCDGLSIVGVRIPAYSSDKLLSKAWSWLEFTANAVEGGPAVVLGDLNVSILARSCAGNALRRILANGWRRATPLNTPTYFGYRGIRTEIDHILVTAECEARDPMCVIEAGGFALAGTAGALSDHAAVMCTIEAALACCDQPGCLPLELRRRYL